MWQIKIHSLVLKEDLHVLDSTQKQTILKAIEKKLSLAPESYGEPLKGKYFGYWLLRAGDYRIVYRILKDEIIVLVIKVGIRKDDQIYKELFSRIKKLDL